MENNKKIFIGGTGRSGTTIFSRWLGSHSEIQNMPYETRFIIDKYGLIDLYYSLTTNYSHDQSRLALKDFYIMMSQQMTSPSLTPYLGFDFSKTFRSLNYKKEFESFFNKLHQGTFIASDYHSYDKHPKFSSFVRQNKTYLNASIRILTGRKVNLFKPNWPKEEMYIGKYFSESKELTTLMANFINNLFGTYAKHNHKINWCEDTPANMLHIDFLSLLFDDAYFFHLVRNPIGVAYSYKNQFWAPKNYTQIIALLSNLYEKYMIMRQFAVKNKLKYKEIKLENLSNEVFQKEITDFLKLDSSFDGTVRFKEERVNYYKELIPKKEYDYLYEALKKYIKYYKYE